MKDTDVPFDEYEGVITLKGTQIRIAWRHMQTSRELYCALIKEMYPHSKEILQQKREESRILQQKREASR